MIKQIFIAAILIRLLIMPLYFHPDIKDIAFRTSFLSRGVTNIYEHLKVDPTTKVNAPDFAYPPLTYFFLGTYQIVAQPFLGPEYKQFLLDFSGNAASSPNIFRYLFILKLPYLLFDVLVGVILLKLIKKDADKKASLLFWFFNPVNLYAIYMIGQFDIIPAFLTFLSFYLWNKGSFKLSGLSLGLGASFKSFPLLLLPFFILSKEKTRNKIIHATIALTTYGLTILPYLNSVAFRQDVLFSNLSQRIFENKLNISSFEISLFVLAIAFICLSYLLFKKITLLIAITAALLSIYTFSRFHAQWIIWIMPFLALIWSFKKVSIIASAIFCICYFIIFTTFNDKFLTTGLLSPISLTFLEIPSLNQLFDLSTINLIDKIAHLGIFISIITIMHQSMIKRL